MAPVPGMTEKDLPSQEGRIFLITGGYAGCGFELAKILYSLNGTVYIAGRSEDKAASAIISIRESTHSASETAPDGQGSIHYLHLDLADLTSIKTTAEAFLARESRLDVVWHNAGVMVPPDGAVTAQDYELQLGTNALGPFLLQQFLTPVMRNTAALDGVTPYETRVVWLSSVAHSGGPGPDGVDWDDLNMTSAGSGFSARLKRYGQSKAMNNILAAELAAREARNGLGSVSCHPGRLTTDLQKDLPFVVDALFRWWRQPPRMGALSELYAGFCELDKDKNGGYIVPYGKFGESAGHVAEGLQKRGSGPRLWKLFEDMLAQYME